MWQLMTLLNPVTGHGGRLRRWIIGLTSLILLVIAALLALSIHRARQDALAAARLQVSYLAAALQQDSEGALDAVALAAELVKRRVETEGDASFLAELKQEIAKYAPALTTIAVIAPDGTLRSTSGDVASLPGNFSDFDFFRLTRDSATVGLRLGEPVAGLLPNRGIIPATQRLEKKDDGFAGVVLFLLDPEHGTAMYRRVDLGMSGALLLISEKGNAMWGYTLPRGLDPSLIGALAVNQEALAEMKSGSAGTFIATSPLDGIERVYAWQRLVNFPVVALVGLGKAEALAGAKRQALRLVGLGVLSAGFLLALAIMLSREISRRIKQALALEETNAKLAVAKSEAEEASQSKSRFLANIGHELRTPLNAILGFAELIRSRAFGDDPVRYAGYAGDIYESGTYLLNLITNLLDLSKIEAGKFELHESQFDLSHVGAECLRLVESLAKNRGVELLASGASGVSLYADQTAVRQIIINLLANAITFTPKGGTVLLATALEADRSLTLFVKDSGIGMTKEEIRQAQEPFRQVKSEFSQRGGTGLGLPLVKQLIELHGGTLTIESSPGSGTAVSIHFPAWRTSAKQESGGRHQANDAGSEDRNTNGRAPSPEC